MEILENKTTRWGVAEGVALCVGLFVVGLLAEYLAGPVSVAFWAFPLNLIAGLLLVYVILMVHWLGRNKWWGRWLSGMPMSLVVILWLLYLALLAGVIPQSDATPDSRNLFVGLGFTHIVSSWFFLLHATLFLFVLGLVTLRRLTTLSWRNAAFFCNHAGLWIALAGGILGTADRKELYLTLPFGKPMNTAIEKNTGQSVLLPFSVELKRFILEEYPPKFVLVDADGNYFPSGKPDFLSAEKMGKIGALGDWDIEVAEFLNEAVSGGTSEFRAATTNGGATALRVIATNRKSGVTHKGWVSAGNFMVSPVGLWLEEESCYLVMPEREPKRFASELLVWTVGEEHPQAVTIEVNRPADVAGYRLYQSSYNREQGRWSVYSGLTVATDPVLPLVYIGIYMMLVGALLLFVLGKEKK